MRPLDTSTGVPLYLQVAQMLKEDIAAGQFGEGDAVPSLRVASAELRVNLHTVGKAYSLLEREGVLSRKRGGPYRVASVPDAASDLLLNDVEALLDRGAALGVSPEAVVELVADAAGQRVRRKA